MISRPTAFFPQRNCEKDGIYRYSLNIKWSPCPPGKKFVVIMCNPSTADGTKDDATTHILRKWAQQRGYGEVNIINLFSYISTNQNRLFSLSTKKATGEKSNQKIKTILENADTIIAAWGNPPRGLEQRFEARAVEIESMIAGTPIFRVGRLTLRGNPRHPRRWYIDKSDTELHSFAIDSIGDA